ncbi:MAG: sensor histidine kinase [Kiritimatiellia bacterium]
MRVDRSLAAAVAAGVCGVASFVLIVVVARSFRHAIADISDSEMRVTIVDASGSVVYDTDAVGGNHAAREEIRHAFADGRGSALRHSETLDRDFLYCARRVGDRVVRLAFPYTGVIRSERLVCMGLVAAGLVGALIVVLVFQLTHRLARRLADRERQLEIVTENERFRREFTSNVTHELKSPITAILSAVEMLGDGSRLAEDERRELFDIIHGECERLGSLVGDVLSLAQVEREEAMRSRDFAELPLEELMATVVSQLQPRARAARIALTLVRNDAVRVNGDALRLEDALRNLIDNAIRYSGSDRIEVASTAADGQVKVRVSDFGVGIPAEHLPHVFERFYRVNKSRSRALGGTGLGLAIVKHVVQLHGGTVSVRSVPGVRTDFVLVLPVAGTFNS